MKFNFTKLVAAATFALVGIVTPVVAQEEELSPTEKNAQSIAALESKVASLSNLKVTGYVQAQWLWTEDLNKVGPQGAGKPSNTLQNQFMVRRGRIKFAYTYGAAQIVFQPDFTEKGVGVKDAYALITAPTKWIAGQAGIFDRPFGYEIQRSSSVRETPERSMVFLALFPGEREVGAQVILKGKSGILSDFTLNAGMFNGNGISQETDSKKDFIGKLAYQKKTANASFGVAASIYDGGVMNTDSNYVFTDATVGFTTTHVEKYSYSKRQYIGASAQYVQDWKLGTTYLCAEYLTGAQPGTSKSNVNPSSGSIGTGVDVLYLRDFNGGYIQWAQNIGATKHTLVVKYDWYDPNTAVKGDEIGKAKGTGAADIAYTNIGLGYNYRLSANIKFTAYYNMVTNEKSANLKGYNDLIPSDTFTARVQLKF